MNGGIIELDLHGRKAEEAKRLIDAQIDRAGRNVYRLRLIHGFHGGTGIKNMIWEEYSYGREPRVVRLEHGMNQGITELVLREY
ncbi:Smr/MutS family protein [Clostridium transplantifaecale]|uniref:Smr/MutS family protein n=1 Tax=Clostridium transplantifaecale TaxID=2479838 RepID=UPI000F63FCAD|nr:Smr/MutS family protein [Clostridium transplantifaecale]